jgi:DNA-binding MarR family transcriptional regulator
VDPTTVKRDPAMWRRRFVLQPMSAIQRSVHQRMLAVLEAAGYEGLRVPHLSVFGQVPRDTGLRMGELAVRLEQTPGATTQLVAQLEELGLVTRSRRDDDGRAVVVGPTERAEAGYEAARRFIAGLEVEWAGVVGPRRFATFRSVLDEIAAYEAGREAGRGDAEGP